MRELAPAARGLLWDGRVTLGGFFFPGDLAATGPFLGYLPAGTLSLPLSAPAGRPGASGAIEVGCAIISGATDVGRASVSGAELGRASLTGADDGPLSVPRADDGRPIVSGAGHEDDGHASISGPGAKRSRRAAGPTGPSSLVSDIWSTKLAKEQLIVILTHVIRGR